MICSSIKRDGYDRLFVTGRTKLSRNKKPAHSSGESRSSIVRKATDRLEENSNCSSGDRVGATIGSGSPGPT